MLKLEIVPDPDPMHPRKDWDRFSTLVTWHRRYELGDENPRETPDEYWESVKDESVGRLPVYMYEHGGIALSTGSFSCPWDSGQLGFIWMSKKQQEDAGIADEDIEARLQSDIEVYNKYLNGGFCGYRVIDTDNPDDPLDSCWGFDDEEYCRKEGEEVLKHHQKARDLLEETAIQFSEEVSCL